MAFSNTPSSSNFKGIISRVFRVFGRILWGLILFLFWAGFLGWALYDGYKSFDLVNNGVSTVGTVTNLQEIHEPDAPNTFKPIIQYKVGNQTYTFIGGNSSSPSAYQIGEGIELFYNPAEPENAQINTWYELWFFPGIITLVFLVAPTIMLLIASGKWVFKKLSNQY